MKVLIIEDESYAAKRLQNLLNKLEPTWDIVQVIDEVKLAINWLNSNANPDVIFMDIQLSDGYSFEIFDHIEINSPVIFTTAFDQYALKAFGVNGIDYLLKPLDENKLKNAIQKTKNRQPVEAFDYSKIASLVKNDTVDYKERFLVKKNDAMWFVPIEDIAFFNSESSYTFIYTKSEKKYLIDDTLEVILNQLNPKSFFQINRKMIVNLGCILKINSYFNSRYKLELKPGCGEDVIVSRNRSKSFKKWLDS